MTLSQCIEELFQRGVELWIDSGQLQYHDPLGKLTPELTRSFEQHKSTLSTSLRQAGDKPITFYPLSSAQQTLWFLYQVAPKSSSYNIKFSARILSAIDIDAFQRAFQVLIDRHPSLRTTYSTLDEIPVQLVHEHLEAPFEVIDASTWSDEELHDRMLGEADRPFDLEKGPLLRVYLFSRSSSAYILWLLIHHIAIDVCSFEMLVEELGGLYLSEQTGHSAELPLSELQYKDYVRWETQMLAGPEGEEHWAYLQKQFSGELPVLNLSTDRPRPPVQTYNTSSFFRLLPEDLVQQLSVMAQTEGVSLYTVLMSAFFVLLYRYTNQEDILLGTTAFEEICAKFSGVAGHFVNEIPLRTDLSGNPPYREFLHKLHTSVQAAFEHQAYPSHSLAKRLQVRRDLSRPPLFQTIFTLQKFHQSKDIAPFLFGQEGGHIVIGGLEMESMCLEEKVVIFVDLQLTIVEEYGSFSAFWQYNTDLFDSATIERMAGHFQMLLEGSVAHPEQHISDIPILTEAERHQILIEWNNTNIDYPKDRCVHNVFETQVEHTPDAVAVVFGEQQMTYRELNGRANRVAHYLQAMGVGPDVLVGLCVERSLEMVIGLLGILKAGGAYIPLDPAYPQDRLSFMLEDARGPVLLTQKKSVAALPEHGAHAVCLDTDWSIISCESEENPVSEVTTENLAYVIYTSGSTGRPKGVAMKHLALLNLIFWHLQDVAFSRSVKTLQFAPVSFDVSFQEMFSTWCTGGTLVLISESLRQDPVALLHVLKEKSVERLFLPFVALQQLCEVADSSQVFPESLREIITAGEQLQITAPVAQFFKTLKNCSLHNHYGPTESHVVTAFPLTEEVDSWLALPPIGWPIANTQMYILDRSFQPVPIGVPGELYIGGDCLARGYLNRPDLTEEKFILNPFMNEADTNCAPNRRAHLYKTGDLARYLADGSIEFLGRLDHQVKIRGFRVELGEIETLLSSYSDIREAAVVAWEDGRNNKRLVAYLVLNLMPDRIPFQSDCLVELDRSRVELRTEDISFDGVSLRGVPVSFIEGENISLRLLLPGESEERWLKGKISWCQGDRAGIQFMLSPTEQAIVHRSVEYLFEAQGFAKLLRRTASTNLRNYLAQKLPDYMIPSSLIFLNSLPLTPSGKVNRRALPEPERTRPELEEDFVAPRSFVEKTLADIWCELLDLERVGIHDDFFELGGDSLTVTRLASRLRGAFRIEMPIPDLFEITKIADLAEVIEKGLIKAGMQTIPRRTDTDPAPLSFAQQRLWFLEQLEAGHATYNIPYSMYLTGPLDIACLERSINEIVSRHDVLRTSFATVNGKPLRAIAPKLKISLSVNDLRKLPRNERETEVQRLKTEDAQQLFNLSQCPLFRITLLRMDEEQYIFLMTTHHIIYDGWSIGLFIEELAKLYEAFSTGKPSPLSPLPIQYSDFAQWQHEWLQGEVWKEQWSYWKQQLSGNLTVLELPTDRPRPVRQTFQGETQSFVLPQALSEKIRTLSRQEKSTPFITLLAAFKTLLYRYTGQDDIIVGSPVANRNRTEIEQLIGFFVNTLVLRTNLSGNPTFRNLVKQVHEMTLGAYAHQDMPLDRLVEELHPERESNRQPLFQVMFAFQDIPMQTLKFSNISLEPLEIHTGTAMFDLTLDMMDTEKGVSGIVEYNTDLFDASTITRIIRHFQILLEGIVADPEQHLSALPMLSEAERHQMLVEWNDTKTDYPNDSCIHELFEAQVEKSPEATAVVFEGQKLSYRELNRRANQLAHYLQTLGAGPEVFVGICTERSLEVLVGILGVLKSGAAYMPMEPTNPTKRLTFMLEDTNASVLITQQHLKEKFSAYKAPIVCLDTDWDRIGGKNDENPDTAVTSENLAYIIYTSGSTGLPKGVLIPHRALVNRCVAAVNNYDLRPQDRVLQFASISFDVSLEEIFPSLSSGATLILRPEQVAMSFEALSSFLEKEKLTVLNLPTAYWHEWVSELARLNRRPPFTLRLVIVGTEQASVERLAIWQSLVDDRVRWINAYGPTEATITTTMYEGKISQENANRKSVPIGRPIDNTRVYLLDKNLQPVPVGIPGELYINSVSLARGYLNQPELTAEKFIHNPFSDEFGSRLYKSGDLARYLPDGNIEFLGRSDDQVKISGFRIELGEIESVLNDHPAIRQAIVVPLENIAGDKRLAAYVVTHQGEEYTASQLRDFLKTQLPDYMIPGVFTFLDALPMTSSGKMDRRTLLDPNMARPTLAETFVAPRNQTEEMLASIWAEVLGLEQIDINENFFDLGGHSLLATQLVSKLSTGMNRDISVKYLFFYPTIAQMATVIGKLPQKGQPPIPVPVVTVLNDRDQMPSFEGELRQQHSSLFRFEDLSLQFAAPFYAVALDYFPGFLLEQKGLSRDMLIHEWCRNLPTLYSVTETQLGSIGIIMLPLFDSELYLDKKTLVNNIIDALEISKQLGAHTVSLPGLLPSATDYGRDIAKVIADRKDLPIISTGHATTCASVVLTIKKILQASGRDLSQEQVGCIGLGSIGSSTLRLMLKCLPHPKQMSLCDVYNKIDFLEKIQQELLTISEFQGRIRIMSSQSEVPPEIYDATLIVGATNVSDILDVTKLQPGTMIVDDSGPHCFRPELAIERFEAQKDILFTEGGVLRSPSPIVDRVYWPSHLREVADPEQMMKLFSLKGSPFDITSCVLSGLLSSRFDQLFPTLGEVDAETSFQHYELLEKLGFQSADLHCEDYILSEEHIQDFRRQFGTT